MKRRLALVLTALLLAGCGGGGNGNTTPATAKTAPKSVTGSVVISIPNGTGQTSSSKLRYPQFVSPNAASVAMNVNGGSDTIFNVGTGSSLCVTAASGTRTCTLTFGAPVGSDTFGFLIFSGANGTGAQLASATTVQTIAAGTAFNFTVAMNAAVGTIVTSVDLNGNQGNCPNGTANFNGINEGCAGSVQVTIAVDDPSGAQITGSTPYAAPINITTSDPSLSVSPAQVTAPGQTVTLSYSGAPLAAGVTNTANVTLTAGGIASNTTFFVDRSYLYVANSNAPPGTTPPGGGNIAVYQYGASGTGAPVRTLTGGLSNPVQPLLDANDNLWVLDNGPYTSNANPYINVYAPGASGSATPIKQITNIAALDFNEACETMAFNPAGTELFVTCDDGAIHVFPTTFTGIVSASSAQTVSMTDDSWSGPEVGMAFDNSGNLYVTDIGFNTIDQYVVSTFPTSGAYAPIVAGHYMSGGTAAWPANVVPVILAVNDAGTLYASIVYHSTTPGGPDANNQLALWNSSSIPCTNCQPTASLTSGLFSASHALTGIAIDAPGNVYMSNPFTNAISVFARSTVASATYGTANPSVLRTVITGSSPDSPNGMTVGP